MPISNRKRRTKLNPAICLSMLFITAVSLLLVSYFGFNFFINDDEKIETASVSNNVEGASNSEDNTILSQLVSVFQVDQAWGEASACEKENAKASPGFQAGFSSWLDRDRGKIVQTENSLVFTDKNIETTIYMPSSR